MKLELTVTNSAAALPTQLDWENTGFGFGLWTQTLTPNLVSV